MDENEDFSLTLPDDEPEAASARRRPPIRVYVNGVEQRPAQAVGSFLAARAIDAAAPSDDPAAEDAVIGGKVTVSAPFCTRNGIG